MRYLTVTPTKSGLEYTQFIKEIAELRKEYKPGGKHPEAYEKRRTVILRARGKWN